MNNVPRLIYFIVTHQVNIQGPKNQFPRGPLSIAIPYIYIYININSIIFFVYSSHHQCHPAIPCQPKRPPWWWCWGCPPSAPTSWARSPGWSRRIGPRRADPRSPETAKNTMDFPMKDGKIREIVPRNIGGSCKHYITYIYIYIYIYIKCIYGQSCLSEVNLL